MLPHAAAAEVKVTVRAMDAALAKVLTVCTKPESITTGEWRLTHLAGGVLFGELGVGHHGSKSGYN